MTKNQLTGTATQPQCNRKFCQCNNDQYCTKQINNIGYQVSEESNFEGNESSSIQKYCANARSVICLHMHFGASRCGNFGNRDRLSSSAYDLLL